MKTKSIPGMNSTYLAAIGEYRPLTSLVADSTYHIIDTNQIEVNAKDGFTAFHRSDGRKGTKFIER